MSKSKISAPDPWLDVSDKTGFNYHWKRERSGGNGIDWYSIRMTDEFGPERLYGKMDRWCVELYPDPTGETNRLVSFHDSREEALDRVRELMKEHS